MGQVNQPSNLLDQIKDLRQQLAEVRRAVGLASATITKGGLKLLNSAFLSMVSATGVQVFYVGPDGAGGQTIQIRRADNTLVLDTQRDITSGNDFWAFWDRSGHIVLADDVQAGKGMAKPWLSVPMTPLFSMAASSVYGYMNLPVASLASETILWAGRIPIASHPKIQVNGVWGQASGANNTTYKLYVDGNVVGTWTENGTFESGVKGSFDLTGVYDRSDLSIQVTAQSTGSGLVACHVHNVALRQS